MMQRRFMLVNDFSLGFDIATPLIAYSYTHVAITHYISALIVLIDDDVENWISLSRQGIYIL